MDVKTWLLKVQIEDAIATDQIFTTLMTTTTEPRHCIEKTPSAHRISMIRGPAAPSAEQEGAGWHQKSTIFRLTLNVSGHGPWLPASIR